MQGLTSGLGRGEDEFGLSMDRHLVHVHRVLAARQQLPDVDRCSSLREV